MPFVEGLSTLVEGPRAGLFSRDDDAGEADTPLRSGGCSYPVPSPFTRRLRIPDAGLAA
jgi:hypothetical protein